MRTLCARLRAYIANKTLTAYVRLDDIEWEDEDS